MASIKKEMKTIFCKVQYNKIDHPEYAKRLTKLYERTNLDTFWNYFISFLKVPLTMATFVYHKYVGILCQICSELLFYFGE